MNKQKPVWLHPGTPEYLAFYRTKVQEECARFEQDTKAITMSFEISGDDRLMVDEAINRAMEFTGTSLPGIALEHICTAYLQNGPIAQAMTRMEARVSAKKIGLAELMKEVGPDEVMETFNALFSGHETVCGGVHEKQ